MDTTTFLLTEQFDAVWAVLGNPVTGEHLLTELRGSGEFPLSESENLKARLGGFVYCGCFGYRSRDSYANGHAEQDPGCAVVMVHAFRTFAATLTEYLEPKSDFESWMKGLHDLTDTRD